MEREAAHNAPFISSPLLRAEMVKGMSWHGRDFVHTSPGEGTVSHFFQGLETWVSTRKYLRVTLGEAKVDKEMEGERLGMIPFLFWRQDFMRC